MITLLTGEHLAEHLSIPFLGYVGHLTNQGLEKAPRFKNPLLGPPAKSYFSSTPSGPWQEGRFAWSSSESPTYRLTLFTVTPGCFEESTEHDSTLVAMVPKGVTKQLRQKMLGNSNSVTLSLPILDQIPEESAVGAEAQGPAGPDFGAMDE